MAYLIGIEGGDGSGKDTQKKMLVNYLKEKDYLVNIGREPGGEEVSEQIRKIILEPENKGKIVPLCELFLFLSSRAQFFTNQVSPFLEEHKNNDKAVYLTVRSPYSSIAYQGYGRGISINDIVVANRIATGNIIYDLVCVLDVIPKVGLKVSTSDFKVKDRIEAEGEDLHSKVNQGYRELKNIDHHIIKFIEYTSGNPKITHQEIIKYVNEKLELKI